VSGPAKKYDIAVRHRRRLFSSIRRTTLVLYVSLLITVSVELLVPYYNSYGYKFFNLSENEAAMLGVTYSRISFLISPLIRDVTSLDAVVDWHSYNALQSNISNWPTKGHSHYNAYSGGQAFTIRCSDGWWKDCVWGHNMS
jgi:hypothetical protein